MDEIARFLIQHPPFSLLPHDAVLRIAGRVQIEYFAENRDILQQGKKPAAFLYIVRRGTVDLLRQRDETYEVLDTLGEGEPFGYVSLIRERAPVLTVRSRSETLVYLLPAPIFHQLRRDYPAFAQFFARSLTERLDRALESHHATADPELFQTRLRDMVKRPPVTIAPGATVRTAAQTMREQNIACLLVESNPPGIITDRDLRNRVVAEGRSSDTRVSEIMTSPIQTMPGDNLVFEGLLLLLERGFHHLPVTENDRIIGIVTRTDVVRRKSRNPVFLATQLQRARTLDDLRMFAEQISDTVGVLLEGGARVADIGRVVAIANDALLMRLLANAEADLGPPPCPYAWMVLGSEGRYEQTLRTDQDNALIYADAAPPDAQEYFAALANRVVEQLVFCGFPRCPGDIMASNPQWRQPLNVWRGYFHQWITVPDEEALLHAAIFFDYRQVYGTLDAMPVLRQVIRQARGNRIFLGRLARTALRQSAPLNLLRQLRLEQHGDQRDLLDLKLRGSAMIVDLARLFALEAGVTATSTIARLKQAAPHSSLSQRSAEELTAAFELISLLRLRHQYHQQQRGEEMTNYISFSELSALEQRDLKDAVRAVDRVQRDIEHTFQTAMLG